ncbi:hypothetical protein [Iningainema tapete]|nr:hypothetical protein [Iningainema tapete]
MGDSRKNIREFPEDVQKAVGYALQLVQGGETFAPGMQEVRVLRL